MRVGARVAARRPAGVQLPPAHRRGLRPLPPPPGPGPSALGPARREGPAPPPPPAPAPVPPPRSGAARGAERRGARRSRGDAELALGALLLQQLLPLLPCPHRHHHPRRLVPGKRPPPVPVPPGPPPRRARPPGTGRRAGRSRCSAEGGACGQAAPPPPGRFLEITPRGATLVICEPQRFPAAQPGVIPGEVGTGVWALPELGNEACAR